jgi:hypothetical protein
MEWLRDSWQNILLAAVFMLFGWIVIQKLNSWTRDVNAYIRQTDARIDALEMKAALWERSMNDRLAHRDDS